jgi:hypothetical protein
MFDKTFIIYSSRLLAMMRVLRYKTCQTVRIGTIHFFICSLQIGAENETSFFRPQDVPNAILKQNFQNLV